MQWHVAYMEGMQNHTMIRWAGISKISKGSAPAAGPPRINRAGNKANNRASNRAQKNRAETKVQNKTNTIGQNRRPQIGPQIEFGPKIWPNNRAEHIAANRDEGRTENLGAPFYQGNRSQTNLHPETRGQC